MLGADPVPVSRAEAEELIASFRPQLAADQRTRDFRNLVLNAPARSLKEVPVQRLLMAASVDLLPLFARDLHGLTAPPLPSAVRSATFGLAGTLRWAFSSKSYR